MPEPAPLWTRRRMLAAGAGVTSWGLLGLTGCSVSDPTIEESPRPTRSASTTPAPTSSPTPKPDPTFERAATAEQGLAELAGVLSKRSGTSKAQRAYLRFLVDAHTDHAQALAGPDPAQRPQSADVSGKPANTTKLSLKRALRTLADAQAKLAASHRASALEVSGPTAALWGSLAVAAETYAAVDTDDPPSVAKLRRHRALVRLSDVAASQEMLRQLHAMIYGYQVLLGQLSSTTKAHRRAIRLLRQRRELRDDLIDRLSRGKHEVPAAAAAYVPSPSPTSAKKAARLARTMETALLPFCGIWLGAAGTDAERARALTALQQTARNARDWGASVPAWPGYAD